MSRYGVQVARDFGAKLPAFDEQQEAEQYWHELRDEHLALLEELALECGSFTTDYTVESLKRLEGWYFELYETDSFGDIGSNLAVFETCMAMYLGEVAVRSAGADSLTMT
jgi:hypothetical protein